MHSAVFWCFIPLQKKKKKKLGTAPLKDLNDTVIVMFKVFFTPYAFIKKLN